MTEVTSWESLETGEFREAAIHLQASSIAERWHAFEKGEADKFYAYFMLDDDVHQLVRDTLLDMLGASKDLPQSDSITVLTTDTCTLQAHSNIYPETHKPYDVYYVGQRLDSVEPQVGLR